MRLREALRRHPGLALALAAILAVTGALAFYAHRQLDSLVARAGDIARASELERAVLQMRDAARERYIRLGTMTVTEDAFERDWLALEFDALAGRFLAARGIAERLATAPADRGRLARLRQLSLTGTPVMERVRDLALEDRLETARGLLLAEGEPVQQQILLLTGELVEAQVARSAKAHASLEREIGEAQQLYGEFAVLQAVVVALIALAAFRAANRQQAALEREVARRRESEALLAQSHARLEAAVAARTAELSRFKHTLDQTLDCVFIFEARTLRFVYVNEGAKRQVGYSEAELLTMHPYDIKPDFPEPRFRALIAPLIAGEHESLTFATVHRHRDGHDVPVEIFLQYLPEAGAGGRFIAVVRDLSERERVARMKRDFVATVSHELRTPLTSISGALGLLAGGVAGPLPEKGAELVAIARRNAERLTLLVNDLLDISRLESGRLAISLKTQPFLPILVQGIEMHRTYGAERGVDIVTALPGRDPLVAVDADRLLQVLANLLSNAIKFSPPKGVVRVAVEERDTAVRVSVSDQGPGVPEAFRPRLFEKFEQADSGDARGRPGTGLGLAISRGLIEAMGGRIGYVPGEQGGASFYFELPLGGRARPEQTGDQA